MTMKVVSGGIGNIIGKFYAMHANVHVRFRSCLFGHV